MTSQKMSNYRWTISALVFFATSINYLDRAVISLLKADLESIYGWSESDYSNFVISFQLAYAVGLLVVGRLIDKIGTKVGYALSVATWSLASVAHAFASTVFGFSAARAFLGITEAGNFPSAIKAVAEWFPKKERALATGLFNSGANIGAIIAPLTVPLIARELGWQWAFIITGGLGFIWLIFWLILYEIPSRHARINQLEFDYIHSDEEPAAAAKEAHKAEASKLSWLQLLRFNQTWAFVVGKFLTDPVWWFYLFWLPAFLKAEYGLVGTAVSMPIVLVYSMSTFGSIFGGWLPMFFIKQGWQVFKARKSAMLIFAMFALPVAFAQLLGAVNMWLAVIIIGIAAAGHQAWSANIFTTVSDMFPKKSVASVTGIGGMAGALGGLLISKLAGLLFDHYKALGQIETGYYIMFIICGLAYLSAWLIMHVLVPSMKPIELKQ
jgi:ACS family hexuronate transporter-like MFS transporter